LPTTAELKLRESGETVQRAEAVVADRRRRSVVRRIWSLVDFITVSVAEMAGAGLVISLRLKVIEYGLGV
jgi:hypothetical protein